MKRLISNITILTIVLITATSTSAQVSTSLYFMDNLPHSNALNPAMDPNYSFYFGIPVVNGVNVGLSSDIGLNDIYQDGSFFWNSEEDYDGFVDGLPRTSFLSAELNTSLLNFGFALGKGYAHFGINHRTDFRIGIPKDFFTLNDLTINHDFSGLEFQLRAMNEYAFGYSREITDKLIVGAKVKILSGIANASLNFEKFDLTTTAEEWAFDAEANLTVSGPVNVTTDENGIPSEFEMPGLEQGSEFSFLFNNAVFNSQNKGLGFDFGAEYTVIPKLKVSASLIDLGSIKWKQSPTYITYTADYSFTGLSDVVSVNNDGTVSMQEDIMTSITDSLKNVFSETRTDKPFSNTLSPKLFIGAEYELIESFSVGFLSKTRFVSSEVRQNFMLNANANLKRVLTLGLNYNIGVNSQNSYGGVIGFRVFPFYLYFATDILPGYSPGGLKITPPDGEPVELPIGIPPSFSSVNMQFGLALTIGERSRQRAKNDMTDAEPLFDEDLGSSSMGHPF